MPEGLSETRHATAVAQSGQNICLIQDKLSAADLQDQYKFIEEHGQRRSVDVQTGRLRPVCWCRLGRKRWKY